jgi:hypothetical protein
MHHQESDVQHDNMNREEGLFLNKLWKYLIQTLKEQKNTSVRKSDYIDWTVPQIPFSGPPNAHFLWECLTCLSSPPPMALHRQASPIFLLVCTCICQSYSLLLHVGPLPSTVHITLKMEAARSFKTLVSCHNTTLCYNPEDHDLNLHHFGNLRTCIRSANSQSSWQWYIHSNGSAFIIY